MRMARRPALHQPICWALAAAAVAIGTSDRTRSGYITPHSSTCMPPIDPPMTVSHCRTPRWSATAACVRTMSRIDTTGNRDAHGRPSAGWGDAGPVVLPEPTRRVAVARERVAHEHGVPPVGSQLAPGLVGELHAVEQAPALE